jgi:fucose 4-O-acetylase-like acetyltransferase
MSKRIEYIDIARGIGILLVVLGHNDFGYISPFGYKLIYSFHMPLFFFLSGYFLNVSVPFVDFFKKRFNSLLKPYLFTIFLIYFASVSFNFMSFGTAIRRIVKSMYGAGQYIDWVQLWFLPHLFVVSLYAFLFFVLFGRWNNRYIRWVALVVTLGISSLFLKDFYPFTLSVFGKQYELFGLPFSLDLVLLSGFFFILGSEIRQVASEKTFENIDLLIGSGVALLLSVYFSAARNDFNTRTYESYIINTIEAVTGILFVLALSRQIELRTNRLASLFKYFGQTSLFILLFHVPIQDFWGQKVFAVVNNQQFAIWLGFFMGVAGSVLIYELFIKANPVASWWFGRKMDTPAKKEPTSSGTM